MISNKVVYPVLDLFSIKMLPKLAHKSLVIGFIGPRGAGKSLNLARLAITDDILKGRTVWSNMDIGVRYFDGKRLATYHTEPLNKLQLKDMDELYSDGCLVIDEVNMEVAEARRSQSNTNLIINNIVQQLRKRRLDFLWSAQSEMHVDNRLRWQTDIFVKCTDVSKDNGPGELTKVEVFDYSGILKGKNPDSQKDAHVFSSILLNKPWWNTYDTFKLQGMEEEKEYEEVNEIPDELREKAEKIKSVITKNEKHKLSRHEVYQVFNAYSHKEKERVTELLGAFGLILDAGGRNYVLSELAGMLE